MLIQINKGLDIPIPGTPEQTIAPGPVPSIAALVLREYRNLKLRVRVAVGDTVVRGQVLVEHKALTGVCYTSPASGMVTAIERGARRQLQSIVIAVEGQRSRQFSTFAFEQLNTLSRERVQTQLLESGLWPLLRTRPYSDTPEPDSTPHSIFVTAIDTRPLSADPQVVIGYAPEQSRFFEAGLHLLARLGDGTVYVCVAPGAQIEVPATAPFQRVEFAGPHPAGLVGTHIHFLDPIHSDKTVWTVAYQDVIAMGELFMTGHYPVQRVVALAGPAVRKPRLLRVSLGTPLSDIVRDEIEHGAVRIIAGSPLDGVAPNAETAYLGTTDLQISALHEKGETAFLAWLRPGLKRHSITRAFIPNWMRRERTLSFTCMQNGSPRALVPIGVYERVFPLELLPTQLLRSLLVLDTDTLQKLGGLELDEEDLALCSYVCPSKHEFGPLLRMSLEKIKREG